MLAGGSLLEVVFMPQRSFVVWVAMQDYFRLWSGFGTHLGYRLCLGGVDSRDHLLF